MADSDKPNLPPDLLEQRKRLMDQAAQEAAESFDRAYDDLIRASVKLGLDPSVLLDSAGRPRKPTEAPSARPDDLLSNIISQYKAHPDSGYRDLRYRTRQNYDDNLRRLDKDFGPKRVGEIDPEACVAKWKERGASAAKTSAAILRVLANFGYSTLKIRSCLELKMKLADLKLEATSVSRERLTDVQAAAIRRNAHEMGRPSIALAQAIQFDCGLSQKMVIGEWIPISEPVPGVLSDVLANNKKWISGLRWEDIGNDMVLRKQRREADLKKCPMVLEELAMAFPGFSVNNRATLPASRPVIIAEGTKKPWSSDEFRRYWRKFANAAGVPEHVKNMDSRKPRDDAGRHKVLAREDSASGGRN